MDQHERRIQRLEAELREIRQTLSRIPARIAPAGPVIVAARFKLKAVLAAGESALADLTRWNADTESYDVVPDSEETIWDFRESGSSTPSGRECLCVKIESRWLVASTRC